MVRRFILSLAAAALCLPLIGAGAASAATGTPPALSVSPNVPQVSDAGSLRPPALEPPRPLAYPQGIGGAVPLSPAARHDTRNDLKRVNPDR
jgi:hypothetical protein